MIPFGAYTHTLHDCIFCVYLYALPWQPQSGWLYVSLCRFSYSRRLKIYFFNFFYFFRAAIDCGRGGGGNENDRRLLLCGVVCTWRNRFFYLRWRLETCLISSNLKRGKRRGCSKIKPGEGEGVWVWRCCKKWHLTHGQREKVPVTKLFADHRLWEFILVSSHQKYYTKTYFNIEEKDPLFFFTGHVIFWWVCSLLRFSSLFFLFAPPVELNNIQWEKNG